MHDTTNFIRMMSPDAGGTDQVTQNRGYVAIPEVGDQVMVGFVHNHPDRPFVMGGMFHEGTALGGFADNRVKSIMTRSGHKVVFTEDESIIITDKSGNEIHLDTTGSNMNITAPETMTLNCKNMFINVSENINTIVGMNSNLSIGGSATESVSQNKTISVGLLHNLSVGTNNIVNVIGNFVEYIKGNLQSHTVEGRQSHTKDMVVNSQSNIKVNASTTVKRNSGEKTNDF